jgi:hypothetical protein
MPYTTTTLTTAVSSTPGAGSAVALNWRNGMPASVSITASSSLSWVYIQQTYDDIMQVPSSLVTWTSVTTGTVGASNGTLFGTSAFSSGSLTYAFAGPVAGVRMYSTGVNGALTMKVLQGESW